MEIETMSVETYKEKISETSESGVQSQLMEWTEVQGVKTPELLLLFAIPNGGHRHIATAARMKREGVKAGVPDLFLPVARGKFHGLFIEMKVGKNKASDLQMDWLKKLKKEGYRTVICYGFEEARDVILDYLDMAK